MQDNRAVLSGILKGTATTADGNTQPISQPFANAPLGVSPQQAQECQILFLDIGPILLDLLGLQVDLSEIVLSITAVRGPGNLLCALVGILDTQ